MFTFMKKSAYERETREYLALSSPTLSPAIVDYYVKQVKRGSGVTFSLVTGNFSTVAGTAFATNLSTDMRWAALLYPYVKVTVSDGSNTLVGYPYQAGTGETLGEELNPDVGFASAAGWTTQNGWSINESTGKAVAVIGSGVWLFRAATRTVGGLYKSTLDIDAIAGASVRIGYEGSNETGPAYTTTGSKLEYHTQRVSTVPIVALYRFAPGALTGTFDNLSSKQVLTPSATGFTVVSAPGGTTQSWASTGANVNSASYTVTFERP